MDSKVKELIDAALKARENAYAPYSKFKVGAALLLKNGNIISGSNVENASYGLCSCAERNTMFQAYNLGYRKEDILAIAVVGQTKEPVSPCGACRQVMYELLDHKCPVYLSNLKYDIKEMKVEDLMPYGFGEIEDEE